MKIIDYLGVLVSHDSPREKFFKEQLQDRLYRYFGITLFDLPHIFGQMGIGRKEYELELSSCSSESLRFFVKTNIMEYVIEIRPRIGLANSHEYCMALSADGYNVVREYRVKREVTAKCVREIDIPLPENEVKDYLDV